MQLPSQATLGNCLGWLSMFDQLAFTHFSGWHDVTTQWTQAAAHDLAAGYFVTEMVTAYSAYGL